MPQSHSTRGAMPACRLVSLLAVATAGLVFTSACNDDADPPVAIGGTGAAGSAGHAGTSGAFAASTSGAFAAGSGGTNTGDAGSGSASGGDAGASGDGPAGAAGESGQTMNCTAGGAEFIVGNYEDAAGDHFLLRTAAKATTFAAIPAGAATPAKPPRLFLVERFCMAGGALLAKDETSHYRLDFLQLGNQLSLCLSPAVPSLDAALALPIADVAHASDTGCAGRPFTLYATELR